MYVASLTTKLGNLLSRASLFSALVTAAAFSSHVSAKTALNQFCEDHLDHVEGDYTAPLNLYLKLNEIGNAAEYRESQEFFSLATATINSNGDFKTQVAPDLNPDTARLLGVGSAHLLAPQHPYNTNLTVAFAALPATRSLRARFMASRSIVIWEAGHVPFSLKLGTNFPHKGTEEPLKADVKHDIQIGMARSRRIEEVDQVSAPAKYFGVLREVLSVSDGKGRGYLVRELTPLLDGNYYIPAFSIPYIGEEIAARHGQKFADFWGEHYAKALGRAKAELLLRHKFQFDEANTQNIVIQLDKNFMPTGKIIFFDLGDTSYVELFVRTPEWRAVDMASWELGKQSKRYLNPNWYNSQWQMDKGGLPEAVSRKWGLLHDHAYIDELRTELGAIPKPVPLGSSSIPGLEIELDTRTQTSAIEVFLNTPAGQKLLADYDFRIRKK